MKRKLQSNTAKLLIVTMLAGALQNYGVPARVFADSADAEKTAIHISTNSDLEEDYEWDVDLVNDLHKEDESDTSIASDSDLIDDLQDSVTEKDLEYDLGTSSNASDEEENYKYVVELFEKLPTEEQLQSELSDSEKLDLLGILQEAMEAYDLLDEEWQIKFENEHGDLLAIAMSLNDILTGNIASTLSDEFVIDKNGVLTSYKGLGGDVVIPEGVVEIGASAFYDCDTLNKIKIPNSVKKIGTYAFYGCDNLTELVFPSSISAIEEGTFTWCSSLRRVVIPSTVTYIQGNILTFMCLSLTDIYYLGTEEEWNKIDGKWTAFDKRTVHFNDSSITGNKIVMYFSSWDADAKQVYLSKSSDSEVLPMVYNTDETTDSSFVEDVDELLNQYVLVKIENGILKSMEQVETRFGTVSSITNSTMVIDDNIYFTGQDWTIVSSLYKDKYVQYYVSKETVVGLKTMTRQSGKLESWNEITGEITIDGKKYPTNFTDDSFLASIDLWLGKIIMFDELDGIVYAVITQVYQIPDTNIVLSYVIRGEDAIITGCNVDAKGILNIPDKLDRKDVTTIGEKAFCGCDKLTEVRMPSKLMTIEALAFDGCSEVSEVRVTGYVSAIADAAFKDCDKIAAVCYSGTEDEWNAITVGVHNECLLNATRIYGIDNPDGFSMERDAWSFGNREDGFNYDKVKEQPYRIPDERYTEVFPEWYVEVANHIRANGGETTYKSMIGIDWGGNCWGMSATAINFYLKNLQWEDYGELYAPPFEHVNNYYTTIETKKTIAGIPYGLARTVSEHGTEITNLIERYQILQGKGNYFEDNLGLDLNDYWNCEKFVNDTTYKYTYEHDEKGDYINNMLNMIEHSEIPLSFSIKSLRPVFNDGTFSHRVVVRTDRKPSKPDQKGWIKVYIYDPNNPYFDKNQTKGHDLASYYFNNLQERERYVELNPLQNKFRYYGSMKEDRKTWIIGCDENGKVLSRDVGYDDSTDEESIMRFGYPDTIQLLDLSQLPDLTEKRDIGTDKFQYLFEENRDKLFSTSDSSVDAYNEAGEILLQCRNGSVIAIPGIDVRKTEGTTADGNGGGDSVAFLPKGKYILEYSKGDITLLGNSHVINLSAGAPMTITVNAETNEMEFEGKTDTTLDCQISSVNGNEDFVSIILDGEMKAGEKIEFSLSDDHELHVTSSDNSGNVNVLGKTNNETTEQYLGIVEKNIEDINVKETIETGEKIIITSTTGEHGSISPIGELELGKNQNQTYEMIPDDGYEIKQVIIDGIDHGVLSEYTFEQVTESHTIHVDFEKKKEPEPDTYEIISSAGDHGTITPVGKISLPVGSAQKYTITPEKGYEVLNVAVDNVDQGKITEYTFAEISSNHTIYASFQKIKEPDPTPEPDSDPSPVEPEPDLKPNQQPESSKAESSSNDDSERNTPAEFAWTKDAAGWKLQRRDGTYVTGSTVNKEDGTSYEQIAWAQVNGCWYAFGADGYARSGFIFDAALNGWFYIDINSGMKTGWQKIDGKWYYFQETSDGKRGVMFVSTKTPDGYYVKEDGGWDGNPSSSQ